MRTHLKRHLVDKFDRKAGCSADVVLEPLSFLLRAYKTHRLRCSVISRYSLSECAVVAQ